MQNLRTIFKVSSIAMIVSGLGVLAKAESNPAITAAPTDAQIAAIVVAANNAEIDSARMAKVRTKNQNIKDFAAMMVKDHSANNRDAVALITKLKVKPEENDASRALKAGGQDAIKKLKGLAGANFDKAYVDEAVTAHQSVLDSIDQTLIPNAKNEQLKAMLVKTRPVVAEHLEHAKSMQKVLNGDQSKS